MGLRDTVRAWRQRLGHATRRVMRIDELRTEVARLEAEQINTFNALSQLGQLNLAHHYRRLRAAQEPLPSLAEAEFRAYSQNGEDGILHYLFALLGVTNKRCLEMCAGSGRECNTANLIINHGWHGLLYDGNAELVAQGQRFYANLKDTLTRPPQLVQAWITAENVNHLIQAQGLTGEIDLFSLDMDGVDWWIWRALEVVTPRVVVLEYQDLWPADIAVTVPYRPDFMVREPIVVDGRPLPPYIYGGASLAAFARLAARKGYRYVGSERRGYNAFFVRNGLGEDLLPAQPIIVGLQSPHNLYHQQHYRPLVEALDWVEVDKVL